MSELTVGSIVQLSDTQKIINSATEAIKDRCGGDMPGDMSAAIQTELAQNQSERVRKLLTGMHAFNLLDWQTIGIISTSFEVDAKEICVKHGITWRACGSLCCG